MISFNFSLTNPFSQKFKNLYCKGGMITKNKAWEFEVLETSLLVMFDVRYTTRQDHAGLTIGLGLFGYEIQAQIYDIRHWDHTYGVYHD